MNTYEKVLERLVENKSLLTKDRILVMISAINILANERLEKANTKSKKEYNRGILNVCALLTDEIINMKAI